MINKINTSFRAKFFIFVSLFLLKVLYIIAVNNMLPNNYLIWSFDKNVNFEWLYFEILMFLLVSSIYLHYYNSNSSYCFLSTLLFIIFFIPVNSGLVLSNNDFIYYLLINVYALLLIWILGVFAKKDKPNKNTFFSHNVFNSKKSKFLVRLVLITICIIEIVYDYSYNGLDFTRLFSEMYETRGNYSEYVLGNENSFMGYFILVLHGISTWVIPIYIYLSIKDKQFFDIFLGVFCVLADFTVSMEKSTLMILIVIFFIFYIEKIDRTDRICEYVLATFVIMFTIMFIENSILGESLIFSVFIRRVMYIPSYMNSKYYQFFSVNDKIWFRQDILFVKNILSQIIPPSYARGGTEIISEHVFDGLLPSPNTGLFAEGYAQMGVAGVFVFPFIVANIAKGLKKISEYYGTAISLVIMTKFALTALSVFLLPSFTLVGIISFVALTYFFRYIKA